MELVDRVIRVRIDSELLAEAKRKAKQRQVYLQRFLGEAIEEKVRRLEDAEENENKRG